MSAFLMTYKQPQSSSDISGWPDSAMDILQEKFQNDPEQTTQWWVCRAHKAINIYDKAYLFKQGKGERGIFGYGEVISLPEQRDDPRGTGEKSPQVQIRIINLVDPRIGNFLVKYEDILQDADFKDELKKLSESQSSGISVKPELEKIIENLLPIRNSMSISDNEGDNIKNVDVGDSRQRVLRSILSRRGQQKFRDTLLDAYGSRCAITGSRVVAVLEAAHIMPYRGEDTNSIDNGLLLRSDIHTLYDLNLIAICPETRTVKVSTALRNTAYEKLHGKKLRLAHKDELKPRRRFLEIRHNIFCDAERKRLPI
ncbi:HNH endonuclease [Komagataeibacter nataicola]|uniref:HNH endonuclease n=1 Tax=Komagataeibacter nataicola TaxID=265960 RepID=UPI0023DD4070|nr:HNH endonuclease [Komagataeibacter nataicola]WEQ55292.1 HNH endonuclease [Komagataeibacter nataicola]